MTPVGRRLPPAEWSTALLGTSLEPYITKLDPEHSLVIVVEVDGRVVSCWAALTAVHVEGVWTDPDARGNPVVAQQLLQTMVQELRANGVQEVLTAALDPEVEGLIQKLGGKPLPGTHWVIPIVDGV